MRLTTTAEALKQARKAGGKSQMDMAAEMDITRRTVQHWDRVGSAQHIMADYELNKAIGRIPETGFNPDLAMINEAIKQAIKSTMEGKNDYTLEAPQEPKK